MNLFKGCKHDYEIIKDYRIKSQLGFLTKGNVEFSAEGLPANALRFKLVIVYKCKKCNKIKETVICNID